MFWQFESWSASKINEVLDDPEVTLAKVLGEADVIQECKAQNDKLVQYLIRPENTQELVKLVTTEPDASLPEKSRFKHANIACELLTMGLEPLNKVLIQTEYLEMLFKFLEVESDLNPLLASFVSKVWSLLIVKKTQETFLFLQEREFVSHLIRHINVSAISDLLLKFVTGIEDIAARDLVLSWLSSKRLIPQLVNLLNETSKEVVVNGAQVLCDIIKNCREQQASLQDKASPNPLLEEIESSDTVSNILQIMMSSKSDGVIVQGTRILQSLIEYKRHNANINQPPPPPPPPPSQPLEEGCDNDNDFTEGVPECPVQETVFSSDLHQDGSTEVVSALDASRLAKSVRQVHAAVIPRLKELTDILKNPCSLSAIPSTVGLIKPLGSARLEVVHFLRALLSSNNPAVNRALAELKTMDVLISLFFEYPWNSFLHIQVEQIIKLIFENTRKTSPVTSPFITIEGESTNSEFSGQEAAKRLAKELILDAKLTSRIVRIWKDNSQTPTAETNPRPGFMGHVIKIANHVNEAISSDEEMKGWIGELPPEEKELWDSFTSSTLSEVNTRLSTPLIADAPSLNDEDSLHRESVLQQGFLEFYMQHLTANLCSEINFQTSEFTEQDGPSIRSRADPLSKINFDLEGQMADQSERQALNDKERRTSNSSDEEEIHVFEEESPSNCEPRPMEVDPVEEPWNSLPAKKDGPWVKNGASSNRDNEEWADFGSFQSAQPVTAEKGEVEASPSDEVVVSPTRDAGDKEMNSQPQIESVQEEGQSKEPPQDEPEKMTVNDNERDSSLTQ